MEFPAPFVGKVQKVEDQWIDYNGHFNMAYYNVIFDRCGDEAFALVGLGPEYVKAANCSFFTLEAHVTYVRELHAALTKAKVLARLPAVELAINDQLVAQHEGGYTPFTLDLTEHVGAGGIFALVVRAHSSRIPRSVEQNGLASSACTANSSKNVDGLRNVLSIS